MNAVNRKFRMMPVDQRIIQSHVNPVFAECIAVFTNQVTPERSIRNLIVRILRVPEAESLMMFCGQNRILHPRLLCLIRPFVRVKKIGIEMIEIFLIRFIGNPFEVTHPFLSRRRRIKPEVKEHPETGF